MVRVSDKELDLYWEGIDRRNWSKLENEVWEKMKRRINFWLQYPRLSAHSSCINKTVGESLAAWGFLERDTDKAFAKGLRYDKWKEFFFHLDRCRRCFGSLSRQGLIRFLAHLVSELPQREQRALVVGIKGYLEVRRLP